MYVFCAQVVTHLLRKSQVSRIGRPLPTPVLIHDPVSAKEVSRQHLMSAVRILLCFICLVSFLKGTVVEAFMVPSSSMVPTVKPRDYILVTKFSYGLRLPFVAHTLIPWRQVQKGHIVVFNRTDDPMTAVDESHDNLVKRVIAVSGDSVEVVGQEVKVNGSVISEPYASWGTLSAADLANTVGPVTVPEGYVFVLGDNRAASRDSRTWRDPFVPTRRIQGQALMIYWSGVAPQRSGSFLR